MPPPPPVPPPRLPPPHHAPDPGPSWLPWASIALVVMGHGCGYTEADMQVQRDAVAQRDAALTRVEEAVRAYQRELAVCRER